MLKFDTIYEFTGKGEAEETLSTATKEIKLWVEHIINNWKNTQIIKFSDFYYSKDNW